MAPPARQVEVVPAPRAGYVWAPGHYEWRGNQYPNKRNRLGPNGDLDRDGIANRHDRDRDGDGVRNGRDRHPDNSRRS